MYVMCVRCKDVVHQNKENKKTKHQVEGRNLMLMEELEKCAGIFFYNSLF